MFVLLSAEGYPSLDSTFILPLPLLTASMVVAVLSKSKRERNERLKEGRGGVARVERERNNGTDPSDSDYNLYSSVLTVVLDNGAVYSTTQLSRTSFASDAKKGSNIVSVVQKEPDSPHLETIRLKPLDEQIHRLPAPGRAPEWDFENITQTDDPKYILPISGFTNVRDDHTLSSRAVTIIKVTFLIIGAAVGWYFSPSIAPFLISLNV